MLRFICTLFKIPYETCKSCETLKQQLTLANEQNKDLTKTLLGLIEPEPIMIQQPNLKPTIPKTAIFARRRAEMERADREAARLVKSSQFVAKPDDNDKEVDKDLKVK